MIQKSTSPLTEILIAVIAPSLILMQLSGPDYLGPINALLLALVFPLGWGARDLVLQRRLNIFAILGFVSVGLTGIISLLELEAYWIAVKEAAVPGTIGLIIIASAWTRQPLIKTILYNPILLDIDRIQAKLQQLNSEIKFEACLKRATWMLGGTFFFSATMNFILARWIVVSPSGSIAFNEELGRLTLISYPMIAIPATIMMLLILYYIWQSIHKLTGLNMSECLQNKFN